MNSKESHAMKRRIPTFTPTLAVSLLLAAAASCAQAEGLYVGGNVGKPDYSSPINGIGGNGGGTGATVDLYGGLRLTPNLAFEADLYSLARTTDPAATAKTQGLSLDAVGSFEFAPQWSLVGRAGLTRARFATTDGDAASNGLKLGVGIDYALTQSLALRAEYDRYHYVNAFEAKPNVGNYKVGLQVGF